MKNLASFRTFSYYLIIVAAFLIQSCQNSQINTDKIEQEEKEGNGRFTDFAGAEEYEFNLLKDPVTGKIPEGIHDAELAQAREIVERQMMNGRLTSVNSYTYQGPNNLGGRTRTVAYDVRYNGTSNRIIIAGGVSGGIYKSTDDGATWVRKSPTGEHFSCTSLAQDTRIGFQDTWYYGVGEATGNSTGASGASYSGNGVYKSTDNGETWVRLAASNVTALESFSVAQDYINKVIVDPTDGNVYIACPATIRRSVDGGTTWTTVLSGTLANSAQFTDIVVSSTGRLYASFGGTNSSAVDGVWASPPGATSGDVGAWTQIAGAGAGGSPVGWNAEPGYGRVVLGIAPSSENLLYALYYSTASPACPGAATEAELFRWDDIGATWTDLSATLPDEAGCLSGNDPFAVQGGYDLVVAVKPDVATTIFIGGTNSYRSTDAGLTWTRIGGYASPASYALYTSSHPDVHSFAFQPGTPTTMLCVDDGGIQRTTDNTAGTVAWTQINTGYRTYQFYHVALDPRSGNNKVFGGAQDNGSTRNISGTGSDFELAYGGDGVAVGLSDVISGSTYEYCGSQLGDMRRRNSTSGLGATTNITPTGESGTGLFVTYFKLDPDNTEILYYANDEILYRTTSASTITSGTWTSMTGVATAVGGANDITAMATTRGAYSAATASLFIGTSNGKVFRLDDPAGVAAGTGPVDITGGTFPAGNISSIAVNPRNDDTLLVTFSNYGVTSVWWTGTANSAVPTWTSVEGTLTLPSYRSSAIHAVPGGEVQYYVGTSVGLYRSGTSFPGTPGWTQEASSSIGNAVVSSLAFRPVDGRLLVGTHGYGMWYTNLSLFPLPIELAEFKGSLQNKNVLLQWSTSSELNSKQFELEKSYDGTNFRKIVTVPAAGTSNSRLDYSYIDKEPLTEKNYYRLRSIDIDGKFKLSDVVYIKVPNAQQGIYVLGNPFRNNITVQLIKESKGKVDLRLIDMSGRLITRQEFGQGAQLLQFNVPVEKVKSGAYLLQVAVDGTIFSSKVVKQ